MDRVTCKCAKCDAKLGSAVNLWTQIGKKYITPVESTAYDKFSVTTSGAIRSGDPDTLVAGCQLQDAECTTCHANLGQKCLKTPTTHVFSEGQVIFRISSLVLKKASDGRRKADPNIKTVLQLRGDAPSTKEHSAVPQDAQEPYVDFSAWTHVQNDGSSIDSTEVVQIQADLDAQREDINRISATGYQVVSSFETAIGRVESQVKQLKDSIDSVRSDGDGQRDDLRSLKTELNDVKWDCQNSSIVSRLDQQLQTTDRVVTDLRQAIGKTHSEVTGLRKEVSATQEQLHQAKEENVRLKLDMDDTRQVAQEAVATSKEYASEVTTLRREIKQLRGELAKERANPPRSESGFSSHELDILASNISKIGNRASHIESLQMDFDLFRTRVQRLEARANPSGSSRSDQRGSMNEFSPPRDELSQSNYGGSTRQKRTSAGRDDGQALATTPPKRVAITSDYSSAATGEWQQSSPLSASASAAAKPATVRRTRTGAIDKRSIKRGTWNTRT